MVQLQSLESDVCKSKSFVASLVSLEPWGAAAAADSSDGQDVLAALHS